VSSLKAAESSAHSVPTFSPFLPPSFFSGEPRLKERARQVGCLLCFAPYLASVLPPHSVAHTSVAVGKDEVPGGQRCKKRRAREGLAELHIAAGLRGKEEPKATTDGIWGVAQSRPRYYACLLQPAALMQQEGPCPFEEQFGKVSAVIPASHRALCSASPWAGQGHSSWPTLAEVSGSTYQQTAKDQKRAQNARPRHSQRGGVALVTLTATLYLIFQLHSAGRRESLIKRGTKRSR